MAFRRLLCPCAALWSRRLCLGASPPFPARLVTRTLSRTIYNDSVALLEALRRLFLPSAAL